MECSLLTDLLHPEPNVVRNAMRLSQAEGTLGIAQMASGDYGGALDSFRKARQRMVALQGTPEIEKNQNYVVDIIAAIDKNMATLNRQSRP